MSYKTVLVHVDRSRHAEQRIRAAARIAMQQDAHLIGAAFTGVSRYIYQTGLGADSPGFTAQLEQHLDFLRQQAKAATADFEKLANSLGVRSCEGILLDDETGAGLSLLGRYSDLIVISQIDRDEPAPSVMPDFPEYLILSSGRPVLMIPYAGRLDAPGNKALVAWDAGPSATRAVTAAIPLLREADTVDVAIFNPGSNIDAHGPLPGVDIGLYLARHGINVNVMRKDVEEDVGDALLSLAADRGSDLIVMGGYGHSRFREILAGGVTRTMLQSMTVPVLLAH
jgi:nucleotide-binding universal stress UspA family protein